MLEQSTINVSRSKTVGNLNKTIMEKGCIWNNIQFQFGNCGIYKHKMEIVIR